MTWQGDMTLDQVAMVEETFATLTPDGWAVPPWVQSLRTKVTHHIVRNSRWVIPLYTSDQTPIW